MVCTFNHTNFGTHTKCQQPSSQGVIAANSSGIPSTTCILLIVDKQSQRRFLNDTGSDASAITPTHAQRQHPNPSCTLRAVNHSVIKMYGRSSLVLTLGLHKRFLFVFCRPHPILCTDFHHHFPSLSFPSFRDWIYFFWTLWLGYITKPMHKQIQWLTKYKVKLNLYTWGWLIMLFHWRPKNAFSSLLLIVS